MTAKVFQIGAADIVWRDTGSSPTELFTNTSLGFGAGRQGARHDFGVITNAREHLFDWWAFVKFGTAPALDETIDVYWKGYHQAGVHSMNDDGNGDAALSAEDKLKNLIYLGSIVVDEASATPEFANGNHGDPVWLPHRFGMPVFWNASAADNLSATAADHGFILTPTVPQAQAT